VNLDIRLKGPTASDDLSRHAETRLRLALSRYSNRLGLVRVSVDVEGREVRCELVARLVDGEELRVDDAGGDPSLLISLAVERLGRLVARTLERRRFEPARSASVAR
jgi:ribosome-associated translation inhibitor RaiA